MAASPAVPQVPWWLDRALVLPILYTFFGACLGFAFGRLKDWFDEHRARRSFLEAVRAELLTIRDHLEGTLKDATEYKELLEKGERHVLHLVTAFQTAIYASQIGKLKSVADPVLIEIIRFYDRLANLERVKARFDLVSYDLTRLADTEQDARKEPPIVNQYRFALNEIIRRIRELLPEAQNLLAKI